MKPPRPVPNEIADAARAYTLLISCTASEQADAAKR
jgi:hypothetical protein